MSSSNASAPASVPAPTVSFTPYYNNPGSPNARFNPTMAIVIIVLIGGCFVFGFVSVFVRKCISGEPPETVNTTVRSPNANPKSRGLDKAAVEALPIVHSSDLSEKDDRECPVCLTEFEPEDSLRLLPACKHVFHQECIDAWFDEHSTCPLCRASLTGAASINTTGEPAGALLDSAVASVPEVSESGNNDIELQRTIYAAPFEDSTQDAHTAPITAPTPMVATMARDDSFNSARGALSRNSQSFKRAARGATALERAHSLGAQFSKPPVTPTANSSRRPPLTPAADSTTTGIRRSSSLGTDIVALRKLLLGGDQQQGNASSIASRRLTGVAMADAPPSRSSWFSRARSMNLSSRGRSLPRMQSSDNWVGIDLEFGKISPPETSTSQTESFTAPERTRSGGWSLAGLRGAMSRSTSDVNTRMNNPHLPV